MPIFNFAGLSEIFGSCLKQFHVVAAGNIDIKSGIVSFGVTHLAKNSSVGRSYSFNGKGRTVGIEVNIHRSVAGEVNILRCDLSVFNERSENAVVCDESSFAVRYCNIVNVPYRSLCKPRRLV